MDNKFKELEVQLNDKLGSFRSQITNFIESKLPNNDSSTAPQHVSGNLADEQSQTATPHVISQI